MTVMNLIRKDVCHESDWSTEREVVIARDDKNSFGISIVGGTVNVSDDTTVSGVFIKNIIPDSPADKCGLLKVGDRILAVDGNDIRSSSHEYAMKKIKTASAKMVLLVQSLLKQVDNCAEISTMLKKVPPPITPCKTPELELINEGNENESNSFNNVKDGLVSNNTPNNDISTSETKNVSIMNTTKLSQQATTDSESSDDDEDVRDMEGRTFTKAGMEIDRASAGNIKRTKDEMLLDTEQEDPFGYTDKKIKKRYGSLGLVLAYTMERNDNGVLGISLAGHRDRTKMACFIAGINPKGAAASTPFQVGDEILEVNGIVLFGRSHLNVPAVLNGIVGSSLKFVILRRTTAPEDLAVKPVTHFPICLEEEDVFSSYSNVRLVSIKKGSSSLGIMIIEGKHSEVGQGIFISDIQEGSMADKAGLNIGEMILSVNKDSLIGCSYEAAASLLKKAEGVVVLKICNPNIVKESNESVRTDPTSNNVRSGKISPSIVVDTGKAPSRPLTPMPQASLAKEVTDPTKAEIVSDKNITIEINTDNHPLGILVVGGNGTRVNTGVVIIDILPNSIAFKDKRLQIFDQILEINGVKITTDLTDNQVQRTVKQLVPKLRLVVFRPSSDEMTKLDVEMLKKAGKYLGIGFRVNHPRGIVIIDMLPGGIAESDGKLQKGDIVTHINSECLSNISFDDCSSLLKTVQGKLTLSLLRANPKKRLL